MKKKDSDDYEKEIQILRESVDDWYDEARFREEEAEVWKSAYKELKRKYKMLERRLKW